MRILYYFADRETNMERWQHVHIIDELYHHGIEVDVFNPLCYDSMEEIVDNLRKALLSGLYSLFMNCCPYWQITKDMMESMVDIDIPKLLICFDNMQAPFMHLPIAKYFDLVWLTSNENRNMFKKKGIKTLFMPYAANPYMFNPHYSNNQYRVCFVGRPYGVRTKKINQLLKSNISCDVFYSNSIKKKEESSSSSLSVIMKNIYNHASFPVGRSMLVGKILSLLSKPLTIFDCEYLKLAPSLSFDEMINVYANHSLSLNITELRNTYTLSHPCYKLHLRTFEIPMSGGLQLTSYNEELASYFREDSEIVFYRDEAEMVDKARFYTNPSNEAQCLKMKLAARSRALGEHTWWERFEKIFLELAINGK